MEKIFKRIIDPTYDQDKHKPEPIVRAVRRKLKALRPKADKTAKPRSSSTPMRKLLASLSALLILVTMTPTLPASAQQGRPPAGKNDIRVRRGPTSVKVFEPKLNLPLNPSDSEIFSARVFAERLIPAGGISSPGENRALAIALKDFKSSRDPLDLSALESFIERFPHSRWRAALELSMGKRRLECANFSEALELFEAAFNHSKDAKGAKQERLAADALGELLSLCSHLGRKEALEKLIPVAEKRVLRGSSALKLEIAKEGLVSMNATPECSYKCGPDAIAKILESFGISHEARQKIRASESTHEGTNLKELKELAEECGLDFQIARRSEGAPLVTPAVVHWKSDHFAAFTGRHEDRIHVEDRTFNEKGNWWLTKEAIERESDGFFLIPAGELPDGWSTVSDATGETVWGKGRGAGNNGNHFEDDKDCEGCFGSGCSGAGASGAGGSPMAIATMMSMQAVLRIEDTPLSYSPPIGPEMSFYMNYMNLTSDQPSSPVAPTFGLDWSFNWVSFISLDVSDNITLRVRGGGSEQHNYAAPNNITSPYNPDLLRHTSFEIVGEDSYKRHLPDGTVEIFNQPDGAGNIFMTKVIDPQGNAVTIAYDSNFRITSITDAIGQASVLDYVSDTPANDGFYKIKKITDPFGRHADFAYDSDSAHVVSITDSIGLTSTFVYDPTSSFIQSMTTPYGTTVSVR